MIHLDTHVVLWLYHGEVERLPPSFRGQFGHAAPRVCPMVRLELDLLHEIGRLDAPAAVVLDSLANAAGLRVAESRFERVCAIAGGLTWTRDPFDRMIAAHALADDVPLITRDRRMLEHCPVAWWAEA